MQTPVLKHRVAQSLFFLLVRQSDANETRPLTEFTQQVKEPLWRSALVSTVTFGDGIPLSHGRKGGGLTIQYCKKPRHDPAGLQIRCLQA
jgi:hypothetical protein